MASSSLPADTASRIAPSDMNRVRTEGPARGADAPLIRLENVHFSYPAAPAADGLADGPEGEPPRTEALAGISLSVRPGEHLCILGGNGSGKSTLVQLMNALLVPTSGTVEAFGFDATTMEGALEIRRRAAMVFQHPDDQMVTSIVADDVAFGPENLGVPQPEIVQRVDAALEAVGMSELAQADPADLSGGQRQRVAIAGALAMQPRVLLLDEPSAMLDAQGHASVQRIVQRLNDRGIGIVHVTHFMDDALLADRVVVLREGTIALEGTPEEVFAQRDVLRTMGLEPPFAMRLAEQLAHAVPDLPVTGDAGLLAHDVAHRISEGADDLHDADGILADAMARTAALYGSARCWYLVGGSTVGLLAGIRAVAPFGSEVIVARGCHKAVYHALELGHLTAHYVTEDLDEGPIIEQDVVRVTHEYGPEDLSRIGRDVEMMVLSRAVKAHLESRIIVHENRTVVFSGGAGA